MVSEARPFSLRIWVISSLRFEMATRSSWIDALCAGAIVGGLRNRRLPLSLSDAGRSAEFLFRSAGVDLPAILQGTEAGKALAEQGLEMDVDLCSRLDTVPVVPVVRDGRIQKP